MRTGLDTVKKALVGLVCELTRLRVSTAIVTTKQNRKRYQPGHLFQVRTVATAPGSAIVCRYRYFAATASCGDCANNRDSLFDYELRTDHCRHSDDDERECGGPGGHSLH